MTMYQLNDYTNYTILQKKLRAVLDFLRNSYDFKCNEFERHVFDNVDIDIKQIVILK